MENEKLLQDIEISESKSNINQGMKGYDHLASVLSVMTLSEHQVLCVFCVACLLFTRVKKRILRSFKGCYSFCWASCWSLTKHPWKPGGTRAGSSMAAMTSSEGHKASITKSSETPPFSSPTRHKRYPWSSDVAPHAGTKKGSPPNFPSPKSLLATIDSCVDPSGVKSSFTTPVNNDCSFTV